MVYTYSNATNQTAERQYERMVTMTTKIKYVVEYDSTERHSSGRYNYTTDELIDLYKSRSWTETKPIAEFDNIDEAKAAFEDEKSGVSTWYNKCSQNLYFETLILTKREFNEDGEILGDTAIDEYAKPIILVENEEEEEEEEDLSNYEHEGMIPYFEADFESINKFLPEHYSGNAIEFILNSRKAEFKQAAETVYELFIDGEFIAHFKKIA